MVQFYDCIDDTTKVLTVRVAENWSNSSRQFRLLRIYWLFWVMFTIFWVMFTIFWLFTFFWVLVIQPFHLLVPERLKIKKCAQIGELQNFVASRVNDIEGRCRLCNNRNHLMRYSIMPRTVSFSYSLLFWSILLYSEVQLVFARGKLDSNQTRLSRAKFITRTTALGMLFGLWLESVFQIEARYSWNFPQEWGCFRKNK